MRFRALTLFLLIAGLVSVPLIGQTAMSTTTLSAAVSNSTQRITVASASGFAAGELAVVDREAMLVVTADTTNNFLDVRRGVEGTYATAHASGATIYVEPSSRFISDRNAYLLGTCTAGTELAYEPAIALPSGDRYKCINSFVTKLQWELFTGVGAGAASDHGILFDGNAADYYFALDDSADNLVVGVGSTVGTSETISITSVGKIALGEASENDITLYFDGNAQDFYGCLDDSADDAVFGVGSVCGTTPAFAIDSSAVTTFSQDPVIGGTTPQLTVGDAGAENTSIVFDGNAQDYHLGLVDSTDAFEIGVTSTVGASATISIASATGFPTFGFATFTINGLSYGWPSGSRGAGEQLQTTAAGSLSWESAGSMAEYKNIYGPHSAEAALEAMLSVGIYDFKYKPDALRSTGDYDTTYVGVMAEEAPWAMHFGGEVLNPVNTFGYTVGSIQALNAKIEALEGRIAELEGEKRPPGNNLAAVIH